jgi:DNA-damage-inducible protein J
MATTTMVHVRVDEAIKAQAAATLADMGLSVSDAVRMLLVRVAAERALPFDVRVPNAEAAAIRELEAGRGQRFESVKTLLADAGQEQ